MGFSPYRWTIASIVSPPHQFIPESDAQVQLMNVYIHISVSYKHHHLKFIQRDVIMDNIITFLNLLIQMHLMSCM